MLLRHTSATPSLLRGGPARILLAAVLPLLLRISPATGAQRGCVLELPVYDSVGNRLDFKVTRLSPEGNAQTNLLSTSIPGFNVRVAAERVSFSDRSLLGRVILATLEGAGRRKVVQRVFLMQCPQRVSIRYGESEAYGDFTYVTIRGHASGCRFDGDWWVRAMPMFGAPSSPGALEGYIQSDGAISLSGQMSGERHIVVIGRDKQPVKTLAIDVVVGGKNAIGEVDLSSSCPK